MKNKKAFIIIFHRYYFYAIAIIFILYFAYGYLDDKGYIKEGSSLYGFGKTFGLQPPNSSLVEQEIFRLTNQERLAQGLELLEWDEELASMARDHSKDMFDRNFFDHMNPDGFDPTGRATDKGIKTMRIDVYGNLWTGIGENLGLTPIGDVIDCGQVSNELSIAKCAVDGWMGSQGHRENILDTHYIVIGIGTYCTESKCWSTQNFR